MLTFVNVIHLVLNFMIPVDEIRSKKRKFIDAELILELASEATDFLESHKWCKRINKLYYDQGVSPIIGIFYADFEANVDRIPTSTWIIVGDIPPAYIDASDNRTGLEALKAYILEMQKWVDHVRKGLDLGNVIPVNAPPIIEYADMLNERLKILKEEIVQQK